MLIILSVLFGALIYVISFWLTRHCKWLYRFFGLYNNVTVIYNKLHINKSLGAVLNARAHAWFGNDIFQDTEDFNQLSEVRQQEITNQQDIFYDRMYYELDYEGKLDVAKAFQSFYLFFRNVFLAAVVSIKVLIILYLIYLIPVLKPNAPDFVGSVLPLLIAFAVTIAFSLFIARWYRTRMVYKMYWFFFTHINAQK